MSTLGNRIKESREAKKMLQAELATAVGVKSPAVISNWEQDVNKPDADKIVKLCSVLGISASYLLGYYGVEDRRIAMTVGEFIKSFAKENGTSAAKIERDLGFSNGYIGSVRNESLTYTRLLMIADYLDVSPDFLWSCGESSSAPSPPALSNLESSLLSLFRRLGPVDQGKVYGYINGLLSASVSSGIDSGFVSSQVVGASNE